MLKKVNSLLNKASYHILPLSIFLTISVVMIVSWFRQGFLYGGGDVGLPTYDPIRLLSIIKNVWWDAHAPGFPYPSGLTAIPLYFFLTFLQNFGMSSVGIQALVFGVLLFLTAAGMYFLFFEVMPTKSRTLPFIAAIFYMLNPYMVIQIWHRFVHTSFFLAALIPILTYIYIRLIKTSNFLWFVAFLGVSFVFSYVYGSLPFMIVIWIPIFIYSLWNSIEGRNIRNIFKHIKIFFLVSVSWLAINIWWLYPFWTTGPSLFAQIHSIYASISTLLSLSNQSSMPMVLRGINPFYTFGEEAWVVGYDNFLMQLVSWTIPLVTLVGIYSIIVYKKRNLYIWLLLFFIAIFVSKGTAAPFGHPFLLAFSKSFLLGAFRNPFEKFGILIPFASAFVFAIGIEKFYFWLKSKFSSKVLPVVFVSILLISEFVIYPWPMWSGQIFGSKSQPAFVEIPEDYKKTDSWIKDQGKPGRILHLPFVTGDAATYLWKNGYNGVEPSSLLFTTPSVSNGFGLEQLDHSLSSINTVFTEDNFDQKKIADVLSNLNIRYIVLHRDIDWKARILIDPSVLEVVLSQADFIEKKETFGDLIIYEIKDNFFTPNAFTAKISNVLTGSSMGFSVWPEIYEDESWPVFFATPVNGNEDKLSVQGNLNYSTTSTQTILTPSSPLAYKENALAELPRPRFLPSSPFYFLILIKERVQILSSPALDKHLIKLDLAGKRLAETHDLLKKGNAKLAGRIMTNYINEFNDALETIEQRQKGGLVGSTEKLMLETIFARHEIVLRELGIEEALENMKVKLSDLGFLPYYELKEELGMSKYNRRIYRFDVQKTGVYEVLLKNPESASLYLNNLESMPLQIDNEVRVLKTNPKQSFLSLGTVEFEEGLHEISYNAVDSINISPETGSQDWQVDGVVELSKLGSQTAFEFKTSKQDSSSLSFKVKDFDKNSLYRIDFDYWIKNGQGPILQVMQDSDWKVMDERFMSIDKLYDKSDYSFYWNSASIVFKPRSNTTEATIRILAEPWNNCLATLVDSEACKSKSISRIYNRESNFVVQNISVKRIFINDMFLKTTNNDSGGIQNLEEVDLSQLSPSHYEGKLFLNSPTFLALLTTFHPEWKVLLVKDGKSKIIQEENHFLVNGYGNLWYLNEEPGEYKIKIEFIPQRRFYKGTILSIVTTIVMVTIGILLLKKKND